ncbi:MAG: PD-(D/E)XK nuclease family protein [Bacteroidales bacterium]
METFLQNTAKYLYGKYGEKLSDCALVFPNRRAGLFFTRYLSSLIDNPLWLPGMFTIADLLEEVSTLKSSDPITLNFELYKVFQSVTKSNESFDEFYSWGEILLGDFDELDKYMVDASALFRNVSELKNLENQFDFLTREQIEIIKSFWSTFRPGGHSVHQKEFLQIWESLAGIYISYKQHLFQKELAYEGMVFRHAAGKVIDGKIKLPEYDKFFIAGFNALNECEKVFFDFLQKEGRVEFLWDYDELYTLDTSHQAGIFMRENLRRYPHTGFVQATRNIENTIRDIDIVAVPSNSGQPKILSAMKDMFSSDDPLKTAIILPDEGLLLPVLSSLPGEINEINVTMGYPLKDTPVYGFVMHLLSLHKNSRKVGAVSLNGDNGKNDVGGLTFYYKDVLALLQHPDYAEKDIALTTGIIKEISDKNLVYVNGSLFDSSEFGRLVFRRAPADIHFTDYLIDLLMYIVKHQQAVIDEKDEVGVSFPEREFIYRIYTGIGRLRDILDESQTTIRFDTLVKLLKKVLTGIRVPFYGEPLGGVQVMGVLETRTLDFENVIWMSVNEGVFPASQSGSSFIPYTLRKAYGLPGMEQQDAVYSYYFYRLLQRTRRMTLVYNTKTDGLFTGEMSRFIYQLKFSDRFNVRERSLVFNLMQPDEKPVYIEKTADIMSRLMEYSDTRPDGKYLSAAGINSYLDCSLRFYFRYIARLPEPDSVTEEIDMATFGNLLHTAAQMMYTPFKGKDIQAADIDALLADKEGLEKHVRAAFSEVLKEGISVGGETVAGSHGDEVAGTVAGVQGDDVAGTVAGNDAENRIGGDAGVGGNGGSESVAGGGDQERDTGGDRLGNQLTGINLIISGVLVTYLRQLLLVDRELVPFSIEALEEKYFGSISVGPEGERFNVRTGGFIDRVDRVLGMVRVVDYKTGGDDADFKSVESLFERGSSKRRKAVFQTFFYAWLYQENSETRQRVSPVLYQVRKFFGDESLVVSHRPGPGINNPVWNFSDYKEEFEAGLEAVMSELFDPEVGFSQVADRDICKYCPYNKLCHRG